MIRAVLDADVLYPLPLRDTLLWVAAEGCFQPCWSAEILDEVTRNLVKDRKIKPAGASTLRTKLETHFEEAMTEGVKPLISGMKNHPKDRHVAACAVAGEASLIVTSNTKDFKALPDGVQAMTPDDFLLKLLAADAEGVLTALARQSAALRNPPMSVQMILDGLRIVAPGFVERCSDLV
jgi:predicted nucleic acid-binding protein